MPELFGANTSKKVQLNKLPGTFFLHGLKHPYGWGWYFLKAIQLMWISSLLTPDIYGHWHINTGLIKGTLNQQGKIVMPDGTKCIHLEEV